MELPPVATCPVCTGIGRMTFDDLGNFCPANIGNGQAEENYVCPRCYGTGKVVQQ